jgi:hypothetical protein
MSWTLLLFSEKKPLPVPDWPRDWQPAIMGSVADVQKLISRELGDAVAWYESGWGQYGDDACLLDFNIGDDEQVECVAVKVRGLGAVDQLLSLAKHCGWVLVDGSSMEIVASESH